jgi:addiction module RelE/StbE family toxin
MVKIIWTDLSLDDIDSIAEYISKDSLKYAKIQVQRFFNRVELLKKHPTAGRIVPELEDRSIRELIMGNYRIIYKIQSKERIDILTVHHSHRMLQNNPAIKI